MTNETYIGGELEIFAHAKNWKSYYSGLLSPFSGKVLEVGAGIGATTAILCDGSQTQWLCLEPDGQLLAQIEILIKDGKHPACCMPKIGTLSNLESDALFDNILYIDVLEHIENDRAELEEAALHLAPGGRLIVLSPAFQFLYSPFDKSIGHYRRYTTATLSAISPQSCKLARLIYLDSLGLLTSLGNRLLLKQSMPTIKQILFWDRYIVPLSKITDRLFGYRFGRSIIAIWQRAL